MVLEENEILFQDFEWTANGDAKIPDSGVKVVSPYFNLTTSVGNSKTFRFAIRLFANGRSDDEFKTSVYCYVHNAGKFGIIISMIKCTVKGKVHQLQQKVEETFLEVFTTEFSSHDRLSEEGVSLIFRVYFHDVSSDEMIRTFDYELRDTCFGEEMWSAAQNGVMTDCEFVVQHQTFLAHKAIVTCRCPVLAERIDHENNNRMEIHDVTNPVVFNALLYFLYTGQMLPLDSANQLQFVDLALNYKVKMAKQIHEVSKDNGFHAVEHHSKAFAQFIVDIQAKLEYIYPATTIENYGLVSVVGRGVLLLYNYIKSCKAEDNIIPPEIFRFKQGGFLGVTFLKSGTPHGDHKCEITCSVQVLSGFTLLGLNYTQSGMPASAMLKVFQHDKAALKLYRGEINLPRYIKDRTYQINVRFAVYLREADERWGYRLHDPSLPSQLWSASKEKIFTDVEIRLRDKTFHAHRAILSARSPVFAAMFENKMSEFHTGIVEIEDIKADVFEDFLEFLYTGRLRSNKNLEQLWIVANKYDLKTLERISEPYRAKLEIGSLSIKLMSGM